MQEAMTLQ